jgi:hypothetical protein
MSNGNRNISGKLRGLPRDRLNSLKIDYPSISPIREFCSSADIRGFKVRVPRRSGGHYNVVILCDNLLNEAPSAYVLDDIGGHYHLWKKMTIPGTGKSALWVCDASYYGNLRNLYNKQDTDPVTRLGFYLAHVIQVLNCSEDPGGCGC